MTAGERDRDRGSAQAVLILIEDHIPAELTSQLQEFIDHDEWGVALDWILTEITESGVPVPRGIVDELTSMAPLMYPGKDLSERLRRLSLLADDTESWGQPPGTPGRSSR